MKIFAAVLLAVAAQASQEEILTTNTELSDDYRHHGEVPIEIRELESAKSTEKANNDKANFGKSADA